MSVQQVKLVQNVNSLSRLFLISRIPTTKTIGASWIKAICRYQEYDYHSKFMICELHFTPDDFVENSGKRSINNYAVPSIFVYPLESNSTLKPETQDISNTTQLSCKIKSCSGWKNVQNERETLFFR